MDAGRSQSAQEGNRAARFTGTGLLSDITSRTGADTRANLDMSNRIAGQHTDFQNIVKQFPLELQGKINGLLAGLNPELFTGSTTTGKTTTSGGLGDIGNLIKVASIAAAPFTGGASLGAGMGAIVSDRRLKRDVVKLGEWGGLGVYAYRYLWSPLRHVGVMAQEVLKVKPEAVIHHPAGFLMVDYGRLV